MVARSAALSWSGALIEASRRIDQERGTSRVPLPKFRARHHAPHARALPRSIREQRLGIPRAARCGCRRCETRRIRVSFVERLRCTASPSLVTLVSIPMPSRATFGMRVTLRPSSNSNKSTRPRELTTTAPERWPVSEQHRATWSGYHRHRSRRPSAGGCRTRRPTDCA